MLDYCILSRRALTPCARATNAPAAGLETGRRAPRLVSVACGSSRASKVARCPPASARARASIEETSVPGLCAAAPAAAAGEPLGDRVGDTDASSTMERLRHHITMVRSV